MLTLEITVAAATTLLTPPDGAYPVDDRFSLTNSMHSAVLGAASPRPWIQCENDANQPRYDKPSLDRN